MTYRSDVEEFLGYSMEYLNWIDEDVRKEIETLFCGVMDLCFEIGGEEVFRIPDSNERRRPVSMTLFESMFFFAALLYEDDRNYSIEDVTRKVNEMLVADDFRRALTYNVDSTVHVNDRFLFVENQYKEIVDAYKDFS